MAAPAAPSAGEVKERRYGCNSCGADLQYAPGTFSMKCPYCGNETSIPMDAQKPVVEHDIAELDRMPPPTPAFYAPDMKSLSCKQCGATTQIPAQKTATKCAFCGSDVVITSGPSKALLKPESLLPFAFDKNSALQKFTKWISKGFFRPSKLKKQATVDNIRGTYVPYFTYDAKAHSDWRGESGTYYYTTETHTVMVNGRPTTQTRQVQHVRWTYKTGIHDYFYDDELVCASRGLAGPLMAKVEPFNTKALVPFNQMILAGYEAEEYSVDPKTGWGIASNRMVDKERSACSQLLDGDTQRNLQVSTRLFGVTFKHALLPVWVASYQYGGKAWRFLVNGQTGEVVGEAPIDWKKVLLVVGIIAVAVIAIAKAAGAF